MLRLVAYARDGALRFPLGTGSLSLGSAAQSDICLQYEGVQPSHAVVRRKGMAVEVTSVGDGDLEFNGVAAGVGELQLLDELTVGEVTLVLEETDDRPLQSVGEVETLQPRPFEGLEGFPPGSEAGISIARKRLLEHLSSLSSWVLSDAASDQSLESVLTGLIEDFGGGAVYLFDGLPDSAPAVKLVVTRDEHWLQAAETVLEACTAQAHLGPGRTLGHFVTEVGGREWMVCFRAAHAMDRDYFGAIVVPRLPFENWNPELGFATVTDLIVLGLVHHVGRYEPILPGRGERRELTLAPGLVVGPSPKMEQLVERMQMVADSRSNVAILGEPGTGRELIARSLHGSGPARHGPFVVLDCEGADAAQLAVDMLGAEIMGKSGPVRREGKVQLASDGTLFLRSVECLPLDLQGKLMRVLRTGFVDGPGPKEHREIEFRVLAASDGSLARSIYEDRFRVDLGAALCQFVVEVPALRERTEDLPLLLQTLVNRFSHETGKRVRGITTRTLQALSTYPFPGNLNELENTVRQMILLARDESPLDIDLLPEQVKTSGAQGQRKKSLNESGSLAESVARVERQAIWEALEKCRGNKSKAARLLGVSRNGLAQKIRRYQL